MKIKIRESLKTIKTFDRADTLAQKSKKGVSSLHNSAEQTQNVGYESETDYAGSELQDKEEHIARMTVVGANKFGRWGVEETRRRLQAKKTSSKVRTAKPLKTKKAAQTTAKSAAKTAKRLKKAAYATAKFIEKAAKAIVTAAKAIVEAVKALIAAIAAGGWVAVVIILVICLIGGVLGSVYGIFLPLDSNNRTIQDAILSLEDEYTTQLDNIASQYEYDVIYYMGGPTWREILAVYAVKINLNGKLSENVVEFNDKKERQLRQIFWDMTHIEAEVETILVTDQDDPGNAPIETKVLYIRTISFSASQMAERYHFTPMQYEMLDELLSEANNGWWAEFESLQWAKEVPF